jgi:hypothetical protein
LHRTAAARTRPCCAAERRRYVTIVTPRVVWPVGVRVSAVRRCLALSSHSVSSSDMRRRRRRHAMNRAA